MASKHIQDPPPLEPEAYTIAIYFFHFLLLLFFLGSSYLARYPQQQVKPVTIQQSNQS